MNQHHSHNRFVTKIEGASEKSTKWIGSTSSLILHTLLFAGAFVSGFLGAKWETVLLVLTTAVSLEAIYLSIFIQMSINNTARNLHEVGADIDEIQEDVDEIQKDVDEIQEDVDEIQKDVDEIQEDVDEIQEDKETPPGHHATADHVVPTPPTTPTHTP